MPVEFESYDPGQGRLNLSEGTNARTILSFLAQHPETGFTPKEIHEATDVARGSVSPTLQRLAEWGLVRHKGEYWAIAPDDRLGAVAAMLTGLEAIDDRYGDDSYSRNDDWAEDLPDLDSGAGGGAS
jgi:DNA-binding transcriptional ArsR family regulator